MCREAVREMNIQVTKDGAALTSFHWRNKYWLYRATFPIFGLGLIFWSRTYWNIEYLVLTIDEYSFIENLLKNVFKDWLIVGEDFFNQISFDDGKFA